MKSTVSLITKITSTVAVVMMLSTIVRMPSSLKTTVSVDIEVSDNVLPPNAMVFQDGATVVFMDGGIACQLLP